MHFVRENSSSTRLSTSLVCALLLRRCRRSNACTGSFTCIVVPARRRHETSVALPTISPPHCLSVSATDAGPSASSGSVAPIGIGKERDPNKVLKYVEKCRFLNASKDYSMCSAHRLYSCHPQSEKSCTNCSRVPAARPTFFKLPPTACPAVWNGADSTIFDPHLPCRISSIVRFANMAALE